MGRARRATAQVPQGRWKTFGIWSRPTGERVHGDPETLVRALLQGHTILHLPDRGGRSGPLVIDHFGRAAIDATLAEYDRTLFDRGLGAALARNGGHVFEDSRELPPGSLGSPQSTVREVAQ